MNRRTLKLALAIMAALGLICPSFAVVLISNHGDWPNSWPSELDPLRASARTIDVANGVQETVFEIMFREQAIFERSWPLLAALKSRGGTLTLYQANGTIHEIYRTIFTNDRAAVRVYWPANGGSNGLTTGPPWPDSILSKEGELPEFVAASGGGSTWIAARVGERGPGFYFRARVDLELVVDGSIIDLSRIRIPESTRLVDKRKF